MKKPSFKARLVIIIVIAVCVIGAAVPVTLKMVSNGSSTANTTQKTYTVAKGTITNEISAAGNLALSTSEDLAFEVAGYVSEVEVSVGDTVTKGQELAKLDTTEWDKNIKTLEKAITTAQRNLTDKQAALIKAQRDLTEAQRAITAKQLAVRPPSWRYRTRSIRCFPLMIPLIRFPSSRTHRKMWITPSCTSKP